MMTLYLEKRNGRFDARAIVNFIAQARNGTYRVDMRRSLMARSNRQLRWLFGCIYPLLLTALNAEGWDDVANVEELHEYMLTIYAGKDIVDRDTGEIVRMPGKRVVDPATGQATSVRGSTREMDSLTMSAYCRELIRLATETLGMDPAAFDPEPRPVVPDGSADDEDAWDVRYEDRD